MKEVSLGLPAVVWLLAGAAGWCDTNARAEIEKAYRAGSDAMSFRFLDGICAMRTRDYTLVNRRGKIHSGRGDKLEMAHLLEETLATRESVTIESFRQVDPGHAECTTVDHFSCVLVPAEKAKAMLRETETRTVDEWVRVRARWLKRRCRVLSQAIREREATAGDFAPPSP